MEVAQADEVAMQKEVFMRKPFAKSLCPNKVAYAREDDCFRMAEKREKTTSKLVTKRREWIETVKSNLYALPCYVCQNCCDMVLLFGGSMSLICLDDCKNCCKNKEKGTNRYAGGKRTHEHCGDCRYIDDGN